MSKRLVAGRKVDLNWSYYNTQLGEDLFFSVKLLYLGDNELSYLGDESSIVSLNCRKNDYEIPTYMFETLEKASIIELSNITDPQEEKRKEKRDIKNIKHDIKLYENLKPKYSVRNVINHLRDLRWDLILRERRLHEN